MFQLLNKFYSYSDTKQSLSYILFDIRTCYFYHKLVPLCSMLSTYQIVNCIFSCPVKSIIFLTVFLTFTRSFKKKSQGRLKKHLADLCLLAGLPGEAMLHYSTAIDTLKIVNDWLWMAGEC